MARQLHLHRGILPKFYEPDRDDDWIKDVEKRIKFGILFGKKTGFLHRGDPVVVITGWRKGAGSSNTVRIFHVDEDDELESLAPGP